MKKVLLFFLLCGGQIYAQSEKLKLIQEYYTQLGQDKQFRGASLAFCADYTQNKQNIFNYNSKISLCPASNLKILTSGAALEVLGKDFRFQTYFEYDGTFEKNTIKGNFYIRGSGDPSLGKEDLDSFMESLVSKIKQIGVQKIEGNIIADSQIFDDQPMPDNWVWSDLGCYYGAGVFGLNIYKNQFKIYFQTPKDDGKNTIFLRTEPEIKNLVFVNEVQTGGYSDKAFIFGSPYSYLRYMRGTIPANRDIFVVKGAIPDPPLFFSEHLKLFLEKNGIKVLGKATNSRLLTLENKMPKLPRKVLFHLDSENLGELLKEMNQKSDNLYAESIFKMIGRQTKKSTKFKDASQAVLEFWKSKKIDLETAILQDGSGLSRQNALSVRNMVDVLCYLEKDVNFHAFFYSLPLAGKSGTLKNKYKNTAAEGNLRAKSGSMGGVRAYTGYVNTQSGKRIAFSLIANNFVGDEVLASQKLEKILLMLSELE